MLNKDKKIIKKTLTEIGERINGDQTHLHEIGQAVPAFYMIMDKAEIGCSLDDADRLYVYGNSDTQYKIRKDMPQEELDAVKKILFGGGYDFDQDDSEDICDGDQLETYLRIEAYDEAKQCPAICPVMDQEFLNRNYLFLTWEEAEQCIKEVPYRFSKDAHPYAMTPDYLCKDYRAIYTFLRNIDFQRSTIVLKNEENDQTSEKE